MEILEAIDNLDDLLHRAKPRPLHRSQVRIDRDAYTAAVARLWAAIQTDLPNVVAPAVAEPIGLLERRVAAADGGRITLERDKGAGRSTSRARSWWRTSGGSGTAELPRTVFIPGLELAERVLPRGGQLADRRRAALGGADRDRSDVLGFDTARSTDHGGGPRVQVFVDAADVEAVTGRVDAGLPDTFLDWPVRYGWGPVPVQHHVTVTTLPEWLVALLGVDLTRPLEIADWLVTPQQLLLGVSGGAVFHDDTVSSRASASRSPGTQTRCGAGCWAANGGGSPRRSPSSSARRRSATSWARALAARLARDVMRLALLIARRYAPYSKWLGTAFARLEHPDGLDRFIADAVQAPDLEAREAALGSAYEAVARRFNALGLIEPVDPELRQFHNRPARVLTAYRFADPAWSRSPIRRSARGRPSAGSTRSWTRRTRSTIRTCSAASGTCGPDDPPGIEPLPRSNSRLRRTRPRG